MASAFKCSSIAVLVVEDESLLLWDAVDLIEEAGFKAYAASNAEPAIRLLEKHDDISVLFTDIDMPGSMDGLSSYGHSTTCWCRGRFSRRCR